jgi:uncharacterized membrane protein YsdA (DUF1294 family)
VTYELHTDAKGRAQARNVAYVDEGRPPSVSSGRGNISLILSAAFIIFVVTAAFAGKLPFAILGLYLVTSAVAFVVYALDKSAARNERWRTQESRLHLFALIGGWPGALVAQKLLRHKCKKQSFQIVFWATVVLNCGALGWLFSSSGAKALHSILGVG